MLPRADQAPAAGILARAGHRAPLSAPLHLAVVREVATLRAPPADHPDTVAAPAATQAVTEALTPRAESTTEHRTPRVLALPVRLQRTVVRLPPAPEMLMPVHTRVWQVDPLGRTCARQVPIRARRVARTHRHCSAHVPR